ncbi:MAG: MFS transporter [Opitutus sp.]|nr:MFS transporter [Opitutus sp.]
MNRTVPAPATATTFPAGSPQGGLKVKLAAFMFLQYFIWGAWYVSMGSYLANVLKFGGEQIGAAYGAFAIGSMVSPFFVGLVADRYFASEKLLAALGILGAFAMFALARVQTFGAFYPTLIVYCALFAPTLALGNSLSLHHLTDAKTGFPRIKIFSAVGWIAGGVTLSLLHGEQSPLQFYLAGAVSLAFGVLSFFLPHTPPKKTGRNVALGAVLGLDALALMKKPSFAIFIVCMFLICIPLYFYFVLMSIYLTELQWSGLAGKMTLAQISDVIFLFLLPVLLNRWGYKKTIFAGILAWAVRYFLLAESVSLPGLQAAFIFSAILLHGVCYDFLFIAGQLYVDNEANERNRGAAQGFIAFILWGGRGVCRDHVGG